MTVTGLRYVDADTPSIIPMLPSDAKYIPCCQENGQHDDPYS